MYRLVIKFGVITWDNYCMLSEFKNYLPYFTYLTCLKSVKFDCQKLFVDDSLI